MVTSVFSLGVMELGASLRRYLLHFYSIQLSNFIRIAVVNHSHYLAQVIRSEMCPDAFDMHPWRVVPALSSAASFVAAV